MNQTDPGQKGLGGSITFESLPRLFPGEIKTTTGLVCLHSVTQWFYKTTRQDSSWFGWCLGIRASK